MGLILANNNPIELPDQPLCVLVHQNGIKIKVPDAFTIGITETLKVTSELTQKQWEHISQGPLFTDCFNLMFNNRESDRGLGSVRNEVPIPKTVEELADSDEGVRHIAGLIILMAEASPAFNRGKVKHRRIFLNHPETFLHPAQEQILVSLLEHISLHCYGQSLHKLPPASPGPDQTSIEDGPNPS